MSDLPVHVQFFGDAERMFRLTPELIIELERVSGMGIGSICKQLFAGNFSHLQITETIRLALIGGGEKPETAAALVKTYAAPRPLMEVYPLVVSILETLMFGKAAPHDE